MTTLPLSARPGAVGAWVLAARPKTLSAAVVPVVVGTAVAHATGGVRVGPALAALLGAVLLQIAANFANDVFDYEKGDKVSMNVDRSRVWGRSVLADVDVPLLQQLPQPLRIAE